jgi:beta-fructofuranosidase
MLGSPNQELPPMAEALAVWPPAGRAASPGSAPGGKALTLWVRRLRPGVLPPGDIVSWPGVGIFCSRSAGQDMIRATLSFDAKAGPLELTLPATVTWRDLVLRYAGPRVELLADGVLVDEEWPLGALPAMKGTLQAAPEVQAAVWNRALSDDEVQAFSGGREGLAEREQRILGPELPVGQGWSPRGFNTHVGDCMPFFHAGRFHLFHLFDRHHGRSKWDLGAHQWAHVSTTDLVNWKQHPLAIGLTQEGEGSICTGSVFFHAGVYHGFYSVRMADLSASPLCAATSTDGIHFTKHPPFAYLTAPYLSQPARDPVVFREEATGLFHLLATTSLAKPPVPDRGGCLAHLVSRDLRHWEQREPFIVTGYPGDPECPDYFAWRGWHYLIFSHQGTAHYRMSRAPLGPWQKPAVDTFDGPEAMVMKTAAFTGDRRIGAAFVPPSRDVYAGKLILREIVQRADGTLGTQWPAELAP